MNEYLQYAIALVSAAIMAIAISTVTQLTGPLNARRAIKTGALLWFAFVFTTWSTEYIFEVRSFALLAINTGFWLLGHDADGRHRRRMEEEVAAPVSAAYSGGG